VIVGFGVAAAVAGAATLGRPLLDRGYRRLRGRESGKAELQLWRGEALSREYVTPLETPRWVRGPDATRMRPEDPVLGIRAGGRPWALPWWVLKNHHAANLELEGTPYLVSFCERCTGGSLFDPVMDGKRLRFRVRGLYRGAPLLVDDETGTYWDMFSGEAFEGPLAGRALVRQPIVQSVWKEWLAANPGTLVVDGEGEPRDGHGSGNYPGDPFAGRGLGDTILNLDDRLPPATLVLGAKVGAAWRCYPLSELESRGGAVTDVVAGTRVILLKRPGSLEALAFLASLDGHDVELRFDGTTLVDAGTGSRFTMFGEAIDGPLAGKRLTFVPSGIEEFNTWAAHHPGAEIFAWTPEKAAVAAAAAAATPAPSSSDRHDGE